MSYEQELATAEAAARAAGRLLLDYRSRMLNVREKADRTLVTDADLAAEHEILGRLRDAFPQDGILSEEAGEAGPPSGRQWIVDPLDGTTNYSRGLPFFAVSIALWEQAKPGTRASGANPTIHGHEGLCYSDKPAAYLDQEKLLEGCPAVAVVYLPVLDELFRATRAAPSTLNGAQIDVSAVDALEGAMVNIYFDRHDRLEDGLDVLRRVALACEGRVKNMGSTASMLCYVACGRLDGFVRNATKLWDFAAGKLILEQTGGSITDFEERPLRESGQSLLATNGRIHAALAQTARGAK